LEDIEATIDEGVAVIVWMFNLFLNATSAITLTEGVLPEPVPRIKRSSEFVAGTEESSKK
jgi:hypothetical protein